MSIFSFGLMLAAVTVAEPLNAEKWVTHRDYPRSALRQRHGGYVSFDLLISPEGTPKQCGITYSTGHHELDVLTCQLLLSRARFEPARDASGNAAFAIYRNHLTWWVEGIKQMNARPLSSDLLLTVERLPDDVPDPAFASVAFTVDPSGAISDCTPIQPRRPAPAGPNQVAVEERVVDLLGSAACQQVKTHLQRQPATDQGSAVISIQTAKIAFTTRRLPR